MTDEAKSGSDQVAQDQTQAGAPAEETNVEAGTVQDTSGGDHVEGDKVVNQPAD